MRAVVIDVNNTFFVVDLIIGVALDGLRVFQVAVVFVVFIISGNNMAAFIFIFVFEFAVDLLVGVEGFIFISVAEVLIVFVVGRTVIIMLLSLTSISFL